MTVHGVFKKYLFLYTMVIFSYFGIFGSCIAASDNSPSTVSEFSRALETKDIDNIVSEVEKIGNMLNDAHFFPLLLDIYFEKEKKYPNMAWKILKTDIVKIKISALIARADRWGRIELNETDKASVHEFIKRSVRSPNIDVKTSALLSMGYFNDESDIPTLIDYARNRNRWVHFHAISGLFLMCGDKVSEAFRKLEAEETDPRRKRRIAIHKKNLEEQARSMAICR